MENLEQRVPAANNSDGKEDDDVSVIAVIGKENDKRSNKKQEDRRATKVSDKKWHCGNAVLWNHNQSRQKSIGIIQDKRCKDDVDYVRDSTETSSGASTSGGGNGNIRRAYRTIKKTRSVTEVRRNPVRAKKKDPKDTFPRLRQQLLSTKKKETLSNSKASKRGKSSTKPYMNTRSVTRKMYNVGATYQAPTIKDALEWKEWPVHGMHERPVFHPQFGLVAEYLGRYFTSYDGLSYCEIISQPEVEVVSVDPHRDSLPSSFEKKRNKKSKSSKSSTNTKNSKTSSERAKSFECCMHESFHCVLGYCSQVMTPDYKTNVKRKLEMLNEKKTLSTVVQGIPQLLKVVEQAPKQLKIVEQTPKQLKIVEQVLKNDSPSNSNQNLQKSIEDSRMNSYTAIVKPQSIKNFNQISKTQLFPVQNVYVANAQKSVAITNMKTLQGDQVKIQEPIRSSKNSMVLVNASNISNTQFVKSAPSTASTVATGTSVNKENLGELSSIYKQFDLSEQLVSKKPATKREKKVEFAMTRYLLNTATQTKIQIPYSGEGKLYYEVPCTGQKVKSPSTPLNKTCYSAEATQIAKILSEFSKNATKKPAAESTSVCTVKDTRVNELHNRDENANYKPEETSMEKNIHLTNHKPEEVSMDKNTHLIFSDGRWKRLHLSVEKAKDLKINQSNQKLSLSKQKMYRINPTTLRPIPGRMIEVSEHLEMLQKSEENVGNTESKKSTSTMNVEVDALVLKERCLQDLLEDTAILYCAATGTHQDDLANYIDTLDVAQSIQWLEMCKNSMT